MLQFSAVSKRYASGLLAVDGVELSVAPGEFVSIVGESGCGKSTLLRIASGLEAPTEGGVLWNGKRITTPHSEIGMVFQEPRLMPWLTIRENIAFGIRALPASERKSRVDRALERVGLTNFAAAWPANSRVAWRSAPASRGPWWSVRRFSSSTNRSALLTL